VVAQVAVSLALLVGAGLVTRSLAAAERADRGYIADQVTATDLDLKANGYTEASGRDFYRRLLSRLRSTTGVTSATLAVYTPLEFLDTRRQRVGIDGYEPRKGEDLSMMSNIVAPGYFRTLSIPLAAGREFSDHDDQTSAPVVVVNRTLAERYWEHVDAAIGKRLRTEDGVWRDVVGVAEDVAYIRINDAPRPYFYLPYLQHYRSAMVLHTRGTAPMPTLVDQVKQAVSSLDPDLPPANARSLDQATRGAFIFFRFMATMLFIFGAAGMALAALGTYGLVSYAVEQSTREIGIRIALGASGPAVVRAFLWRGLRLGVLGAGIGVVVAVGTGQMLRTVLFGVSATDAGAFGLASTVVLAGVALATFVPAWRASRTNPLTVLRHH